MPQPTPTPVPPPCAGLVLSTVATERAGDGDASLHADLVRLQATVSDCQLAMTLTFAPGTFSRNDTTWEILLDTDEDKATGFSGRDSAHHDAASMGADYFVDRDVDGGSAKVTVKGNSGGGGTVPVTIAGDQVTLVVPMALLGNDDGRMVLSVSASHVLGPSTYTAILDYLPDLGAALPRTR